MSTGTCTAGPADRSWLRDPLVVVYAFVVVGVALPARLIFAPLGALGAPAVIITIGAVGWWGLAMLRPGSLSGRFHPPRVALITFALVALTTYGVGLTNTLSATEANASLRTLLAILGFVALGLIAADAVHDRDHLDRLLRLVVAAVTLLALMGIVQFVTGLAPPDYIRIPGLVLQETEINVERSIFTRIQATALHPIEFGVVLAVALPLALHYALHGARGQRPSRWRWVPPVLMIVASPMAVSRSSVLGIAVAGVLLALTWPMHLRVKAALAGALLLVAMRALFPGLLGTLRSMFLFVGEDPSISGRTEDYAKVAEFFGERPWLGRGLGTLVPAEHFFLDNEYLGILISSGLLGLAALIALFVVAMGTGRGVYLHASDPAARSLGQALMAATAVSAVTWLTYDGMGFRLNAGLAFILIGAVGALWRLEVGTLRWGRGADHSHPQIPTGAAAPEAAAAAGLAR
ncbi:O-antigen ligase family protein [Actinotalea sp. C106]|uniref:O-antigen ligase family protein n=1 Tax=Actinotalea sp. C106 TaxID=2908644 RepID=UPI0020283C21|nr:O-antigen ligase family protein [Actinotalea sp. C106]